MLDNYNEEIIEEERTIQISFDDGTELSIPVIIIDGPLYIVESETLDIYYACDSSKQDAINEFIEIFKYMFSHYNNLSWDQVTGYGRILKKRYMHLKEEIERQKQQQLEEKNNVRF